MKKWISLGSFDKYQIIFLLLSITNTFMEEIIKRTTDSVIKFHLFAIHLFQSMGKLLSFIPFIILHFKNKNLYKHHKNRNNRPFYTKEYYEKYKRIIFEKFCLIFLDSLLTYINSLYTFFCDEIFGKAEIDLFVIDIVALSILVYIILDIKLYRHQYFSIIIIFIVTMIKNFVNYKGKIDNIIIFKALLNIIIRISNCVAIILQKYIMEYKFCSPYALCFYEGIFYLFYSIIIIAIVTNLEHPLMTFVYYNDKYYPDHYYAFLRDLNNKKELILAFITSSLYFSTYLIPLIIIKNYNVFNYLIIAIFNKTGFSFQFEPVNIISFILIFSSYIIFNEFIEINCFDLETNTKRNIRKRAMDEALIKNLENRTSAKSDSNECEGYFLDFLNN